MAQPISELTDRMREIFGLVVESYLERGLPIGSKVLAGSVSLSPASIRGVMQELEERGLLTHPHTSAGRIPTESGLRLFVDGIMQTAAPDPRERREIERQIARDQPIEDALAAASAALSGLSQAAGVVLAPKQEMRLRQLSFVPLSDTRALAIIVGSDGSVENRIMNEGLNFKVPMTETVIKVDVRVQPHPFREIDASSKEYQIVKMTGMMNFHIDPAFVNDLYQKVGLDFADKVIDPAFNDFVKEVVPMYPIGEILPKREEIRQTAMKKLGNNLAGNRAPECPISQLIIRSKTLTALPYEGGARGGGFGSTRGRARPNREAL